MIRYRFANFRRAPGPCCSITAHADGKAIPGSILTDAEQQTDHSARHGGRTARPRDDLVGPPPAGTGRAHGVRRCRLYCPGCRIALPFRNFKIDHVIPRAKGGSDHVDNLHLLCGACNRAKGTGTQAELVAKLKDRGQLAA